jgi:hypothetical protein
MPKGIPGSGKAKTIKTKAAKIKAPRSVRAPGVRKIKMTAANKNDGKYQCVLVGDTWHLVQSQSDPPSANSQGAWTTCSIWATFKRGYNRQLPDCPFCLKEVHIDQAKKNKSS